MIQRHPSTTYDFALVGAPTGLVGTLTFQLESADDGTTAIAASTADIIELEPGVYRARRTLPATAGVYAPVWKDGATVIGDPEWIEVAYTLSTPALSAGLLTLAEAKARLNITGTAQDAHINALLPGIARLIERETHREFTLAANGTPAERTYWYDGAGVLEIGDCVSVTSITMEGRTLNANAYILQPQDELEPVYYWLDLATFSRMSPAMGFMYNLDRLWPRYRAGQSQAEVVVTADWGWPYVPQDIKLAASWLIAEGLDRTHASGVTAESIAEYSVSFAQGETMQGVMPDRVLDILHSYRRVNL